MSYYFILVVYLITFLGFLYSCLSFLSIASFVVNWDNFVINERQVATIFLAIFILLTYSIGSKNLENMLISLRYYFGFLFFYTLLIFTNKKISVFYLYIAIITSLLIELLFSHQNIFNLGIREAISETNPHLIAQYFGFYEKPIGFAYNSTMTSCIGVIFFELNLRLNAYLKRKFLFILSGIMFTLLFLSLTGFILLLLVFLYHYRAKISFIIIPMVFISYLYLQDIFYIYYEKLTVDSLAILFEYKLNNFSEYLDFESLYHLVFGSIIFSGAYPLSYNDIGWLAFFSDMGMLGIFYYLILIGINFNKNFFFTLFLMFVSNWHYPAFFSQFGNLFIALLIQDKLRGDVRFIR